MGQIGKIDGLCGVNLAHTEVVAHGISNSMVAKESWVMYMDPWESVVSNVGLFILHHMILFFGCLC
jgi:hypothetical protein